MSHSIGRFTQGGFSLVELMIAMTLGLVLVAGVAVLSQNSSQVYRSLSGTGQQTENGRYALEILNDDLQHAGYFGMFNPNPSFAVSSRNTPAQQQANRQQQLQNALPSPPLSPCNENPSMSAAGLAAALRDGLLLPVTGLDSPMAVPPDFSNCITNDTDLVSGTDVLAIRRADTSATAVDDLKDGNAYIQTTVSQYAIGVYDSGSASYTGWRRQDGVDNPVPDVTAADLFNLRGLDGMLTAIRRYHVHVYFIRPWSSKKGDGIPTLVRSVLINGGTGGAQSKMTAEPLVEGVENMQIQYGIDNDIDGTPDQYVNDPATFMNWASVVAVRVNLLVRTLEPDPTYVDSKKTYNLGDGNVIGPPNDRFRRHVFSGVVKLENVGTRRECKQPTVPLPPYCQ